MPLFTDDPVAQVKRAFTSVPMVDVDVFTYVDYRLLDDEGVFTGHELSQTEHVPVWIHPG